MRVNSERTTASDHKVGAGDVLTMALHARIVVWRVLDPGTRRGPAREAVGLYEDLSPPVLLGDRSRPERVAPREAGSGRPTKKQRRDTDRLREEDE